MVKRMLIDAVHPQEIRVVVADENRLEEFDYETSSKKQIKGNIYLAKVTRVEPSLQAAFVEYGGMRQGFLPFSEISPQYYQVPMDDKRGILAHERGSFSEDAILDPSAPVEGEVENYGELEEQKFFPEGYHEDSVSEGSEDVSSAETAFSDDPAKAGALQDSREEMSDLEAANEGVESLSDETYEAAEKRPNLYRRYKIQEVIKRNQIMLVQVIKEERGNKGASLTTYITLPGRYCVLMPNTERQGGVSRRISSIEDRKALREIIDELSEENQASVIIRTAGVGRNKAEIRRDYDYLIKLWNDIREHTLKAEAPTLIHEEGEIIKRSIRDMLANDIDEILVEGEEASKEAKKFVKLISPSHVKKIAQYQESQPLFERYRIEEQLGALYDNTAPLPSGGSIVINPTEALVSIDVNSGRSTRERNIEETALKTNMEAALEIARQLRLRDLAGLVVIDFIDMMEYKNKRSVERALKEALKSDRAKIQVGRISIFGLLEMSRQRLRSSIFESSTITCPTCSGTGMIRSLEFSAVSALRAVESEVSRTRPNSVRLRASHELASYMLNEKRFDLTKIEEEFGCKVFIQHDASIHGTAFALDGQRNQQHQNQGSKRLDGMNSNRRRRRNRGRDDATRHEHRSSIEKSEHSPAEDIVEDEQVEAVTENTTESNEPSAEENVMATEQAEAAPTRQEHRHSRGDRREFRHQRGGRFQRDRHQHQQSSQETAGDPQIVREEQDAHNVVERDVEPGDDNIGNRVDANGNPIQSPNRGAGGGRNQHRRGRGGRHDRHDGKRQGGGGFQSSGRPEHGNGGQRHDRHGQNNQRRHGRKFHSGGGRPNNNERGDGIPQDNMPAEATVQQQSSSGDERSVLKGLWQKITQ